MAERGPRGHQQARVGRLLGRPTPRARRFYAKLFGWDIDVSPDPPVRRVRAGHAGWSGCGRDRTHDDAGQPTAWSVYIGTDDAEALGKKVQTNGGTIVMPAFDVGDQGRMAVFQDPSGAFISAWQTTTMGGFQKQGENAYGWAELSARGLEKASLLRATFGWTHKTSPR